MRRFTFLCLLAFVIALSYSQAAPVPKRTDATPAVLDAGTENHVAWVLADVVSGARIGVRENEKVANLPLVRRQKNWEEWLKKNLSLERVRGTNQVRVYFQDGSPEERAAIINVVVDHYLKNDVGSRRDKMTSLIKKTRAKLDGPNHRGKITKEVAAKMEAAIKKHEEYIQSLPVLVEHAKAR
jgi:hypothetical protein